MVNWDNQGEVREYHKKYNQSYYIKNKDKFSKLNKSGKLKTKKGILTIRKNIMKIIN